MRAVFLLLVLMVLLTMKGLTEMCIIFCGFDQFPTREELTTACGSNPDGFGWSFVVDRSAGRELVVDRSMSGDDAVARFLAAVDSFSSSIVAWAFHARIATHGAVGLANCHPFTVPNSAAVMFHNGVLDVHQSKKDPRTDSQTFAEDYLPFVGGVPVSAPALDVVGGFAGSSKLVFLDPSLDVPLLIVNEGLGHWLGGVWRSNSSYAPASFSGKTATFVPCDYCDSLMALSSYFCGVCGSCAECGLASGSCRCGAFYSDLFDEYARTGWERF